MLVIAHKRNSKKKYGGVIFSGLVLTIQCFTNLLNTNYLKLQQSLKRVSAIISAISAIGFEQERLGRRLHKEISYLLNDKVFFVLGFVPGRYQ